MQNYLKLIKVTHVLLLTGPEYDKIFRMFYVPHICIYILIIGGEDLSEDFMYLISVYILIIGGEDLPEDFMYLISVYILIIGGEDLPEDFMYLICL
jgi:dihydrofolate reductase